MFKYWHAEEGSLADSLSPEFTLNIDSSNTFTAYMTGAGPDTNSVSGGFYVYPNPAKGNISVSFTLKNDSEGYFCFYDSQGNEVLRSEHKDYNEGLNTETFNVNNLRVGMYNIRLKTSTEIKSAKTIIIQ